MWLLTLLDGVQRWLPPGSTTILGRTSPDSETNLDFINIDEASVSRKHAKITVNDDLVIQDLDSRFGVFINNTRLEKGASQQITADSEIRVGGHARIRVSERDITVALAGESEMLEPLCKRFSLVQLPMDLKPDAVLCSDCESQPLPIVLEALVRGIPVVGTEWIKVVNSIDFVSSLRRNFARWPVFKDFGCYKEFDAGRSKCCSDITFVLCTDLLEQGYASVLKSLGARVLKGNATVSGLQNINEENAVVVLPRKRPYSIEHAAQGAGLAIIGEMKLYMDLLYGKRPTFERPRVTLPAQENPVRPRKRALNDLLGLRKVPKLAHAQPSANSAADPPTGSSADPPTAKSSAAESDPVAEPLQAHSLLGTEPPVPAPVQILDEPESAEEVFTVEIKTASLMPKVSSTIPAGPNFKAFKRNKPEGAGNLQLTPKLKLVAADEVFEEVGDEFESDKAAAFDENLVSVADFGATEPDPVAAQPDDEFGFYID